MTLHKRVRNAVPADLAQAYVKRDKAIELYSHPPVGTKTRREVDAVRATTDALRAEIEAGRAGE